MPELTLHFQDGFDGDSVDLRVNGKDSQRFEGLRTKKLLGLAEVKQIMVPEGSVRLDFAVPGKGCSMNISVDAAKFPHLGISVSASGLRLFPSARDFGYS